MPLLLIRADDTWPSNRVGSLVDRRIFNQWSGVYGPLQDTVGARATRAVVR